MPKIGPSLAAVIRQFLTWLELPAEAPAPAALSRRHFVPTECQRARLQGLTSVQAATSREPAPRAPAYWNSNAVTRPRLRLIEPTFADVAPGPIA